MPSLTGQSATRERWNVTRTLRYGNDFNRRENGAINDQVRTDRKEQHRIVGEALPFVTDARRAPDGLKRIEKLAYPPVPDFRR